MKTVYMALAADYIHPGHLNILSKARELGRVVVGVLTDEAICEYKRLPVLSFEHRCLIAKNLAGVDEVIPQFTLDYTENLKQLKPDYVIHGDDWVTGRLKCVREKVVGLIKEWDGELVEVPYTRGISKVNLDQALRRKGTTADMRRSELKQLLMAKGFVRVLEAHSGLTGLIIEETKVNVDGETIEFDGMWESSLTDSTSKGKPDTQAVDITSRISTIDQILDVTTKPMIVDVDNGGLPEHFTFTVKTMERLGVSAVIVEDKVGAKRNSLFGTDVEQTQDSIENFCEKIKLGKAAQVTTDFMIFARIESLILGAGHNDAIKRANAYLEAGADGVMIHSKERSPKEVIEFSKEFKKDHPDTPLVVVPSSYSTITEKELRELGVNIVIYANHLLRSAFPAMKKTAESILKNSRCEEASNEYCMPIKEIITLIPES